jgi:hypothetical protein
VLMLDHTRYGAPAPVPCLLRSHLLFCSYTPLVCCHNPPLLASGHLSFHLSGFVVCASGDRAETHAYQAKPAQQASHSSEVCIRVLCHLSGTFPAVRAPLPAVLFSARRQPIQSLASSLRPSAVSSGHLRTCWLRCGHCRPYCCDCIMYFTLVRACVASTQVILLQSCITHSAVVVKINPVCCNSSHTTLSSWLPGNVS